MKGRILGVDYGRVRMGIARGEEGIASPVKEVTGKERTLAEIVKLVEDEGVEKVVVGNPGGRMGEEVEEFVKKLRGRLKVGVEVWDETLSTVEARKRAIEAGWGKEKRKRMRDALAAAVMLQSFLDEERSNV